MPHKFVHIEPEKVELQPLYDFVLKCGNSHNPRSFAIDIVENIGIICPFDQALVFFIDGNGHLQGQYLKDVDERWLQMYFDYYHGIENQEYNCFIDLRENPNMPTINVYDWTSEQNNEFVQDYIRPKGLKYSCGFALYDLNGNHRTIVALDRLHNQPFTNRELYNLKLVVPMLNNFHKNFFFQGYSLSAVKQSVWEEARLTAREIEVVDLLSQGVSPSKISSILFISQSTTYKHIAHIYEKMKVSSQQELLVKLLRHQT